VDWNTMIYVLFKRLRFVWDEREATLLFGLTSEPTTFMHVSVQAIYIGCCGYDTRIKFAHIDRSCLIYMSETF
jgi:hypothetical protein